MKKFLRQLVFGYKASSDDYINHLRKYGAKIGERVTIFHPMQTVIDMQYPWMLTIGDDVQITSGVKILTHGYDWSVTKKKYSHLMGNSGIVCIGNNVFIGVNTLILPNVTIGDNVIIGAGSIVTRNIPSNCIAVGNPAKMIKSLDDYYKNLHSQQIKQAKCLIIQYYDRFNHWPEKEILYDYFYIFEKDLKGFNLFPNKYKYELSLTNNLQDCIDNYPSIEHPYNSFEQLLDEIKKEYYNNDF